MEKIPADNMRELKVDEKNLYREEIITDLKIATIRQLIPIKSDGSSDGSRPLVFLAQTHLVTAAGPLPIQARLEANSLSDAIQRFPEAIKRAVERTVNELKELEREESSRIVLPGEAPETGQIKLT